MKWGQCCHVLWLRVHPHPLPTPQHHLNLNLWLVLTKFDRGALGPKTQALAILWRKAACSRKGDPPERKAGVCVQPFFNMENLCDRGRLRVLSSDRGLLRASPSIDTRESNQRHPPVRRKPSSCSPTDQEATLPPKRRARHRLEDNNTYQVV